MTPKISDTTIQNTTNRLQAVFISWYDEFSSTPKPPDKTIVLEPGECINLSVIKPRQRSKPNENGNGHAELPDLQK